MNHTRENNNNWRGGKVKTQHGYILIRVGVGHHLADCRGYTYEHRIIAEQKLGRPLEANEKVHHIDGDRENNQPENILVVSGNAEHYLYHRKNVHLRKPGEINLSIQCACGCGEIFLKYDKSGRPRKYITGHNMKDGENERRAMVE